MLLLTVLLCAIKGRAQQSDTSRILQFNVTDGWPSNNIYSVIQDRQGYWWFATDQGVARYNGYELRKFGTKDGLPANDVWKLYEDQSGRIWVYTISHQFGYIQHDRYYRVQIPGVNRVIYPQTDAETPLGFFFISHQVQPCLFMVPPGGQQSYMLPLGDARAHAVLYKKTIWLFSHNYLYRGNLQRRSLSRLCNYAHYDVEILRSGRVLVASDSLLLSYMPGFGDFSILDPFQCRLSSGRLPLNEHGQEQKISLIYPQHHGFIVITDTEIISLDHNFKIIRRKVHTHMLPSAIQLNYWLPDRTGNNWFATRGSGVWMHNPAVAALPQLQPGFDPLNSTFVGYGTKGRTFWWDNKRNTLHSLGFQHQSWPLQQYGALKQVSAFGNDSLCLGFQTGTHVLNYGNGEVYNMLQQFRYARVQNFRPAESHPHSDIVVQNNQLTHFFKNIIDIVKLPENRLIAITSQGINDFVWQADSVHIRILISDRYERLVYNPESRIIWAMNPGRLLAYSLNTHREVSIDFRQLKWVSVDNLQDIRIGPFGEMILLAGNQLVIYDQKSARYRLIHAPFDLSDARLAVHKDMLLIAGRFGLAYARFLGQQRLSPFRIAANAKERIYNQLRQLAVDSAGTIYLNTNKGLFSRHIYDLIRDSSLLEPASRPLFSFVVQEPLSRQLKRSDTLVLNQKLGRLTLDALNLFGNGSLRYRIRIPAIDARWQEAASGELYLGQLQPGRYYAVECRVHDQVWNSDPLTFFIYRSPYWYQTRPWVLTFWTIGILLMLLFVTIIIWLTKKNVARVHDKRRRLTELELRALHDQINPHFIFNTLGTAQYFINNNEMHQAYNHVSKFSKLLRAYLKTSRERYTSVAEEVQMLRTYIDLQRSRFGEKFTYNIVVDHRIPQDQIRIPSLLLQPLVENAINHGLFELRSGGILFIGFQQGDRHDELVITIEDNGIGRARARELKRQQAVVRESYGSKLTEELIQIFRKYEQMDISLEYIDKQLPEQGTIVKITLKNIQYVI